MNFDRVDGGVIRTAFQAGNSIILRNMFIIVIFILGAKYYFIPQIKADAAAAIDRQIHIEEWPINSTERKNGKVVKSVSFNHELEALLRKTGAVKLSSTEVVFNKSKEVQNGTNQSD